MKNNKFLVIPNNERLKTVSLDRLVHYVKQMLSVLKTDKGFVQFFFTSFAKDVQHFYGPIQKIQLSSS